MVKGILGVRRLIIFLAPFLFLVSLCTLEYDSIGFAIDTLVQDDNTVDSVFFTQTDGKKRIEDIFSGLIRSEQKKISGALYRLSNKTITQELLAAHERGVEIEIIFDPGAIGKQVLDLSQAGVPLFIYNAYKFAPLMHHKLLLFNKALDGRAIVSTGSLNLTEAGLRVNAENVTIRDKKEIVDMFYDEFNRLRDQESHKLLHKECLGLYKKSIEKTTLDNKKKKEKITIFDQAKSEVFTKKDCPKKKKNQKMQNKKLVKQAERIVTLMRRLPK